MLILFLTRHATATYTPSLFVLGKNGLLVLISNDWRYSSVIVVSVKHFLKQLSLAVAIRSVLQFLKKNLFFVFVFLILGKCQL